MTQKKKSILIFSAGIIFAVFLIFLFYRVNRFDIEKFSLTHLNRLARSTHGTVSFESCRLLYFPAPHLVFEKIAFRSPGKYEGFIRHLEAYPTISSLLTGSVRFSKIQVTAPAIKALYTPLERRLTADILQSMAEKAVRSIQKNFTGLIVQVKTGKIELESDKNPGIFFDDIDFTVKLTPSLFEAIADCRSGFWEIGRLDFRFYPTNRKGIGRIAFQQLRVRDIPEKVFPDAGRLALSDLKSDIDLSFTTTGFSRIEGTAGGSVSNVNVHVNHPAPVTLNCSAFDAGFSVDPARTKLKVHNLSLKEPEIDLSGEYIFDHKAPFVSLEVTGQTAKIASVRKTALGLFGQFKTTRAIFNYVRDGEVSRVRFYGKAPTLKEFGRPGNIKLDGRIDQGRVFIPKGELNLQNVSGDVRILDGFLIGRNLEGRMGNSHGKAGSFNIGLHKPDAPFHLEVQVDADLSQLPPVLVRLIHNPSFRKEMTRIENCSGRATGKLILGDIRNAIRPIVTVDDFSLAVRYTRTPLKISVQGGSVHYADKQIEVKGADGVWGDSAFKDILAVFDWRSRPELTWNFEKASLIPEQIYPWLVSLEKVTVVHPVNKIKGKIDLDRTHIKGPLFEPGKWAFTASGKITELTVSDADLYPSDIRLKGALRATNNQWAFSEMSVFLPDAVLSGGCRLYGPLGHVTSGSLKLKGDIGTEAFTWFKDKIALPLPFRSGLSMAVDNASVKWNAKGRTDFNGNLAFMEGPEISFKGYRENERTVIASMDVLDADSEASMTVIQEPARLDLNFQGKLNRSTFEAIIDTDKVKADMLSGVFSAHILPNQWINSTLTGFFEARNISFPRADFPFQFTRLSVKTENGVYAVKSDFDFNRETKLHAAGNIHPLSSELVFDLDLRSDTVMIDSLISYFKKIGEKNKTEKTGTLYRLPIRGNLRLNSDRVHWKKYRWSEVESNIAVDPQNVKITILKADLCRIQTPGNLEVGPNSLKMNFNPVVLDDRLEQTLSCIGNAPNLVVGDYRLNGEIIGAGDFKSVVASLKGDYDFHAENGRIFKLGFLSKVFALLNITEIFRGKLPDLAENGFAFEKIDIKGTVHGRKVIIDNAVIDGSSMGIVMKGEVDLIQNEVDIILLVAPFKTFDFILSKTPVIRNLMKGTLVSIPVAVKGNIVDPSVMPLAPASVDSGLLGVMKSALKLPVTLIQPFLPEENEPEGKKKEDQNESHNL